MKYILLLLVASFSSLFAMQKPAAKPKEVPTDEQMLKLHEKVKEIRLLQTNDINLIAARINAEFYTTAADYQSPSASIPEAEEQRASSFSVEVETLLEKKINEHITEVQNLLREMLEAKDVLDDFQKRRQKEKKIFTEQDALMEKANFVNAEHSAHATCKKAAELTYYLSVLYERKSQAKLGQKIGLNQDA